MRNVLNAFRVLETVAVRQPVGVSELARELELPKSSVQRTLQTLHVAGWLLPVGGEPTRWRLATRVLSVASHAGGEFGLREAALPVMHELRDRSEETVHLSVREGNEMVLVERIDSRQVVRAFNPLGVHVPIYASSSGKCVLALLPADDVDRILAGELTQHTDATLSNPDMLRAELAEIRETGYSVNRAEWRREVVAVGAAIQTSTRGPFAAVNISAPASRVVESDIPRLGEMVVAAAKKIEDRLDCRS